MNPLRSRRCVLAIFACLATCGAWAGEKHDAALIEELLKLPAPPPDWRDDLQQRAAHEETPPPDAPLETLAEFWQRVPAGPAPERRVQTRLLESCEAHPEQLASLLRWFPTDAPEFHDRVKAIFDKLGGFAAGPAQEEILSPTYDWLREHSRYFRENLIENVREKFSGNDGKAIARSIQILTQLDRAAAEKLLLSLAESSDRFTHTAALVWLHALFSAKDDDPRSVEWRTNLQRIATDVSAPARVRDYAVVGGMHTSWSGQEDWYLGLFADASLGELRDDSTMLSPLRAVAREDPDRWIPKITPLVGGKNRVEHNNAVRCLSGFNLDDARADALRPLLPWLSDPKWADFGDEYMPRLRLVQSLDRVDLPESVPGLIWVLNHEHEFFASGAAEALRHYGAKEAGGALKAAIAREPDDNHRRTMIAAAQRSVRFRPGKWPAPSKPTPPKSRRRRDAKKRMTPFTDGRKRRSIRKSASVGNCCERQRPATNSPPAWCAAATRLPHASRPSPSNCKSSSRRGRARPRRRRLRSVCGPAISPRRG